MDVLRTDLDRLGHVSVELQLIRESHHSPRLSYAPDGVVHEILVRPPVDSNEDPITPPDALAGNSPFSGPSLEPQTLTKEGQPQCVVGPPDVVVRGTSVSTYNTSEAHKSCMLNEPCDQWVLLRARVCPEICARLGASL